jgi:hypothetical protein
VRPRVTNSPKPATAAQATLTPTVPFSPAQETEAAIHTQVAKADQTQQNFMFVAAPATLEARNVKCKDDFILEKGLDVIRVSNDKWSLFTCSPRPQNKDKEWTPGVVDYGKRYTQITRTDLSQTWVIKHNIFDYSIIDRPDAMLSPLRWTADGKYLYLYPRSYPGGSGFPESQALQYNVDSLYRINLETGAFELMLRGDQYGALALSPDDRLLAYSEQDRPDIIHVINMESGHDSQVKLNEDNFVSGAFVWNSKSTILVITTGYGKQGKQTQDNLSGTALFVLTPQTMHVQKILARDTRTFIPYPCFDNSYWLNENTICLYSINYDLESWKKFYSFNIKTGTVEFLRSFP